MRVLLVTMLAMTHALTPNSRIKISRKNTLDSSVTFDEYVTRVNRALRWRKLTATPSTRRYNRRRYQNIMDQCIVNSDSESAIEDCLKLTKQFEIVDVPPLDSKMAANRAQAQLETLASEKNPLAAPIHLEYYALLALVVILYVDILDVAGIVARFQH